MKTKKKKAAKTQTVIMELTQNEIELIKDALDIINPDTEEQQAVAHSLWERFYALVNE